MKQHNPSKKSSRRNFTKSIACALAATPVVSTYGSSPQPGAEAAEQALSSNTTPIILAPVVFKDHIPPFAISDGSLEIEAHGFGLSPNPQQIPSTGSIPGRWKYTAVLDRKYSLSRVKLIVIYESEELWGNVFEAGRDLSGSNTVVKISLEHEITPGSYTPVSNLYPQLVIKSEIATANSSLILESDVNLGMGKRTHKTREFQRTKYWHPGGYGNGGNALFRISKVDVDGYDLFSDLPSGDRYYERYKAIVLVWLKQVGTP